MVCDHRANQMPRSGTSSLNAKRNTYTGYGIACAAVWAVILALAQRRLDSETRNTLRLVCMGWWTGWTSATIARAGYPPPKKLTPRAEKRLRNVSLVLIALGLMRVIRLLASGNRPARGAADVSST